MASTGGLRIGVAGDKGQGGRQTEKFAGKLFCFSISYRVGLIVPLKSVICLSQKRVNDRFHTAAVLRRAGGMNTHTASRSSPRLCRGKDSGTPKSSCLFLEKGAQDWEWQPRPPESLRRGEI